MTEDTTINMNARSVADIEQSFQENVIKRLRKGDFVMAGMASGVLHQLITLYCQDGIAKKARRLQRREWLQER